MAIIGIRARDAREYRREDASKTLEIKGDLPRRHGDLEREFKDNVAEFSIPDPPATLCVALRAGYRNSKFRNGFLEKYHEKKGLKKIFPDLAEEALSKYSPGFLQETV